MVSRQIPDVYIVKEENLGAGSKPMSTIVVQNDEQANMNNAEHVDRMTTVPAGRSGTL
jgi:hypothetical protein